MTSAPSIMIAAILLTGFAGIWLLVRRRNVLTMVVGAILLIACAALIYDHWLWLSG
jgi:hypothetical protein